MSTVTDPPSHQVKVPLFPVMTTVVVSGIKLFQKYIFTQMLILKYDPSLTSPYQA